MLRPHPLFNLTPCIQETTSYFSISGSCRKKHRTVNVGRVAVNSYVARKDRLYATGPRLIGYHT